MRCYIVGGAVRDKLLGLPIKDRDWVVVGATPAEMTGQGFIPVGKDFPVFLHPNTKEEYALARTERKQGKGYRGFVFHADASVSLEDDLKRRDLTVNAMAMDEKGALIDPYGGKKDLEARILRHTSPAFVEDPLRILRATRFLARFHHLGFYLADETQTLLKEMAQGDELKTLSPERVWVETAKALAGNSPHSYFEALQTLGGLETWYPEVARLFGIPQPEKWHPEIDSGIHTMMVLDQTARLTEEVSVRFAALCHDFGKAATPKKELPKHHGHEERGVPLTESLCERLRVPKEIRETAVLVCRYHTHCHRVKELRATSLLKLFNVFDLWRRPHRLEALTLVARADAFGRSGSEDAQYDCDTFLWELANRVRNLEVHHLIQNTDTSEIPMKIRKARLACIQETLRMLLNKENKGASEYCEKSPKKH